MKTHLTWACALLLLGACASIDKVERGDRALGERLKLTIDGPWNHVNMPNRGPAEVWTMEGIFVDELRLYSGLKDGQPLFPLAQTTTNAKAFEFRSAMKPDEIVGLFEGALTRDGSRFRLTKLDPVTFAGQNGFRFEYELTRKFDNVQLGGLGYGTVSKGELFAIVYSAPRLAFFPRHRDRVEQIARSAVLKE